ncbi:MAG: DUF4623 domain-containing protein [Planctomycetes bacterium]|nr:DUF4623 domain-containing protein [Planctomycetota bacterium]
MLKNTLSLICAATALLSTSAIAQVTLTPLSSFGSNGWLAPGSSAYLTTGNSERGLAYNYTTNNLVLVSRAGGINLRVIDGLSGTDLGALDATGIVGGTFAINMADVAEDGAIYACNLTTSAGSPLRVYKWDSEATGLVTPPTVAYDSVTGIDRTGDAFAVQGGITGPAQFAAAGSNANQASNFVVGPLDGTNASTAFLSVPGTTTTSNDYRLALTFVDQDTLIGNQGATARLTTFDTTLPSVNVDASIPLGGVARRAMDYVVVNGRPLLAVVDSNSGIVTVLDVTDPSTPIELVSATTITGATNANANGSGSVQWGFVSGTVATLYAMTTNNGIQAFLLDLSPIANATDYGTGCDGMSMTATSLPTIGNAGFALQISGVPAVSPLAFLAFGLTALNPGIPLDGLGMTGCTAYTTLEFGVFASGPAIGGVAMFPLPLANDPAAVGAVVTSQAMALTLNNPLNIAASNGTELVIGY